MSVFAGVVSVVLAGTVIAPAQPVPTWLPGEHGGPRITMLVDNWGDGVDIGGSQGVYAHLGANGPTTRVTVEIQPPVGGMHGFYGRLTAPDAFGGEMKLYCGDEFHRLESMQVCAFDVPMTRGVNRFTFDLQSASWEGLITETGVVLGASVGMVPVLEAKVSDGTWMPVPRGGHITLRGEDTTGLRYRIMNTGDMPFRVPESCQPDSIVWPYQQLLCVARSPRPAFSLAGDFGFPIELEDPVGGGASFTLTGQVRVSGIDIRPNAAWPHRLTGSHE